MASTAHLTVEGMSCGGCSSKLKAALEAVPGVSAVEVLLEGGKVTVEYDPDTVDVSRLVNTVEDTGFDVV
ncbi:heavy-metal-associated domain-containing protein [Komagataeibacter sp. FNDCR2]|uniref:heavy-metal-associated domain-containing protein n=1 Tax=Komagataeibacter sp. FNDCR2 TaxID=2878682 RepID=UPI001E297E80|nr:cation transporter [Komagataeibacter sp. FNDCR2]MCE2574239.1 cation transporter [Komagataeibacter sp. FNDCR2]